MIQEYLRRERDDARDRALESLKKLEAECRAARTDLNEGEAGGWVRTSVSAGPMYPGTDTFDSARRDLAQFEHLRHATAMAERDEDTAPA